MPKLSISTVHYYHSLGRKNKWLLLYCKCTRLLYLWAVCFTNIKLINQGQFDTLVLSIGDGGQMCTFSTCTFYNSHTEFIERSPTSSEHSIHCNLSDRWQRRDKKGHSINLTAISILEGIYAKGHELKSSDTVKTILLPELRLCLASLIKFGCYSQLQCGQDAQRRAAQWPEPVGCLQRHSFRKCAWAGRSQRSASTRWPRGSRGALCRAAGCSACQAEGRK